MNKKVECPNCGVSSKYAEWQNYDSVLRVLTYALKNNKHFEFDMHLIGCPNCRENISIQELVDNITEYECPHCAAINTHEKWDDATAADFGDPIVTIKNALDAEKLVDYDYTCPECSRNTYLSRLIEQVLLCVSEKGKELELTDEMLQRLDEMYNAVYECICTFAEKEIPWDMEIIGNATEAIISELKNHSIKVRYPGVVTNEDGQQHYEE